MPAARIGFGLAAGLLLGAVVLWGFGQGWPSWSQLTGRTEPSYTALFFEDPGNLTAAPAAQQPLTWVLENRTGQPRSYRWTVTATAPGGPTRTLDRSTATVPAGGRLTRVVRVDTAGPSGVRTLSVQLDSGEHITARLGPDPEGS